MPAALADKLEVALMDLEILLGRIADSLETEDEGDTQAADTAALYAQEIAGEINVDDRFDTIVNELRRLAKRQAA